MRPLTELSREGAGGYRLPASQVPVQPSLPSELLRSGLDLPQLTEHGAVREFMNNSHTNIGVDNAAFFPLGSCSMVYTPEVVKRAPQGFVDLHPLQPTQTTQGALRLLYHLERILSETGGAAAGTLQPAAGAQSEYLAVRVFHEHFKSRGEAALRRLVLTPDSAHGTNPATAAMVGYSVMTVPSNEEGTVDIGALEKIMLDQKEKIAAMMITVPSTNGKYEPRILDIVDLLHRYGAQVFCDGANAAAFTGRVKFGKGGLGVDAFHYNLHKTFGVMHGSGGPGQGFTGFAEHLVRFMPVPIVEKKDGMHVLSYDKPDSIGTVSSAYGNFLADPMAYAYLLLFGSDGLREASGVAVVAGNYNHSELSRTLPAVFPGRVMHEGVVEDLPLRDLKVKAELTPGDGRTRNLGVGDIAKALMDHGMHPPTVNFPHFEGKGTLLTEPTHSATKQAIDDFVRAIAEIVEHAQRDPEWLAGAPYATSVRRLNEAEANRKPVFTW